MAGYTSAQKQAIRGRKIRGRSEDKSCPIVEHDGLPGEGGLRLIERDGRERELTKQEARRFKPVRPFE